MRASVYNNYIRNLYLVTCVLCLVGSFSPVAFGYTYSSQFNETLEAMLKGDYYDALDQCEFLTQTQAKTIKAEALYLKGTCLMNLDSYANARSIFKEAALYATSELLTEVYMGIADSFFMEQEYSKAISVYEQLIDKANNKNNYLANLYFKLGKSYQRESKWADSKYYFDKLEKDFPQSLELKIVKDSAVGGNFFTIQVGCFSNKQNAEKLQNDLSSKGYDVFVTPFKTNGEQLYRVRVGEFVTRLAAEHTERELSTQEHLPTHIFP